MLETILVRRRPVAATARTITEVRDRTPVTELAVAHFEIWTTVYRPRRRADDSRQSARWVPLAADQADLVTAAAIAAHTPDGAGTQRFLSRRMG
jgi:hypothetical protein